MAKHTDIMEAQVYMIWFVSTYRVRARDLTGDMEKYIVFTSYYVGDSISVI